MSASSFEWAAPPPGRATGAPEGAPAELFAARSARRVMLLDRCVVCALVGFGGVAVARFFVFWFRAEHVAHPLLFGVLSLALWYGVSRIVLGWIALLGMGHPEPPPAPPGRSVAIFTTSSPGEPLSMFDKTLAACARVRYPHTTYLLDDTRDPRFAELAERHGAVHLELLDLQGAKAGKINAALELTNEEFVLVLDPDHLPFREFLDRVLGYFRDPEVGFVQVCQAYYNQPRSGVARGAAEQTYGFYGPTQMGMGGLGTPLVIGANCTFRRDALESIGGHGVGLAEDLVTAIRLHAAGWKGRYTPTILSRGLVPETLSAFLHQQLKWARGVYEVLFSEFPRAFSRLSAWQRLAHFGVGTYYLTGVATLIYLVIPHLAIWFGVFPVHMSFGTFLLRGAPVALAGVALHFFSQRFYCHPASECGLGLHGTSLKAASFFVFCQGLAYGLADRFLRYVPTEKRSVARRTSAIVAPSLVVLGVVLASGVEVARRVLVGHPQAASGVAMLGFALLSAAVLLPGLYWALCAPSLPASDAWDELLES